MKPKIGKGYEFDKYAPSKYWSIKTRIEYLQRRIIVCSIMYYELNENILSDKEYDSVVHQLIEYMNTTKKEILEKTKYWYVFNDFDGSTGFHLQYKLNKEDRKHLMNVAECIKNVYERGETDNGYRKKRTDKPKV